MAASTRHRRGPGLAPALAAAVLALGLTGAAFATPTEHADAPTTPGACRERPGPVPARQTLPIVWKGGTHTDGCFFFSGPADLGRDTHLGRSAVMTVRGSAATLDFGGGTIFRGTLRGDRVVLVRHGTYQYGSPWRTTETISGTYSGNTLHATYGYEECDTGALESCPGQCRIRAGLDACVP